MQEKGIDTPENQQIIIAIPQYADRVAVGLATLSDHNINNASNSFRICAHAKYACEIAMAIFLMNGRNIYTPNNWILVSAEPEKSNSLAASFSVLKQAGILEECKHRISQIYAGLNAERTKTFCDRLSFIYLKSMLDKDSCKALCDEFESSLPAIGTALN